MLQYCQKNWLILTNEHRDFFIQHPWTIQALALRSSGQHVLRWISSNKHEAHAANICMLMWVCMATVTHFYWGNINLTSNQMVWTLFSSVRVQCDSVVLWKAERKVFRNELLLTEYVHCLSIICIHNRGNQQLFVLIKQSSAYFTWERKRSNVMLQTYCKCSHETYNIIIIIITQHYPLWASCRARWHDEQATDSFLSNKENWCIQKMKMHTSQNYSTDFLGVSWCCCWRPTHNRKCAVKPLCFWFQISPHPLPPPPTYHGISCTIHRLRPVSRHLPHQHNPT